MLYAGDNQKEIKTLAMVNGTSTAVIVALVSLLAVPLGPARCMLSRSAYANYDDLPGVKPDTLHANLVQGLESGAPSYTQAKLSLKYGQSHGVFSTPSVLFNGIQIFGYDDQLGVRLLALSLVLSVVMIATH